MMGITILDIIFGVIVTLCFVRGLMRGLTGEIGGLVGLFAAFVTARHFQGALEPYVAHVLSDRNLVSAVAYGVIFAGTMIGVGLVFAVIRRFMQMTFTSWIDSVLGGVVGIGKGFLFLCIIFYLMTVFAPDVAALRTAKSTPVLRSATDQLRGFLPAMFPHNLLPHSLSSRIPGRL